MDSKKFMLYSVVIFGLLGAVTLFIQAYKIWSSKSARSISGAAAIVMTSFFAGYAIYGVKKSLPLIALHGACRIPFWIPIIVGFIRYGKAGLRHLGLGIFCLVLLIGMSFPALRSPVISVLTGMSIYFSLVQASVIVANKARGKVSLLNQIVPQLSAATWVIYGFLINDRTIMINCFLSVLAYVAIIAAWVRYPNPPERRLQHQPATTA